MLITTDEIKTHLRISLDPDSELDPYLEGLYDAALDYCTQYLGQDIPWDSDGLNPSVRAAMLLIIADLHENREGQTVGGSYDTNPAVERLLHFHRIGLGV